MWDFSSDIGSSDEGSEDEDGNMLPWQPNVFSAESDEEMDDE